MNNIFNQWHADLNKVTKAVIQTLPRQRLCPCGTTFTVDPLDNDYLRCPPCRIKLHKPKKPRRNR